MPPPTLVSVIVPVLDGEAHIAEQCDALAAQTYAGDWELIVVDNGCSDRSIEIARGFEDRLPALRIADATARRGLNIARNTGAVAARGELLAFCDCDDVVSAEWLEQLVEAALGADLVGGRLDTKLLNDDTSRAWRPSLPMKALVREQGFLEYAPGNNMAVWTKIAREIRWDESFRFGSSDHGFAWHAQMAGYTLVFAPDALVYQRYRGTIWSMTKQWYRYGTSGPQLYRAFRSQGMPPPDYADAWQRWKVLIRSVPHLWGTRAERGAWIRAATFRVGRLVGSVRFRTFCP